MCPAVSGTVVAAEVVVPPDIHCLPAVGAATAIVVDVVAIFSASVDGAAIVDVSVDAVVSGVVDVGVVTLTSLYAAASYMCPALSGTVVAAEVVVPTYIHCSPAFWAATAVVVDVVVIAAASVDGAAIVDVSVAAVVAGEVAAGVATLTALPAAAPSMLLFCPAQT